MIIIEPPSAYAARMLRASVTIFTPQPVGPPQPAPAFNESYWSGILFETLTLESGPVKIASLVTSCAKFGDFGCRADREERKLDLFRLIGRLIQEGRLRRYARNYVLLNSDPREVTKTFPVRSAFGSAA
jgi:hypothetical protein